MTFDLLYTSWFFFPLLPPPLWWLAPPWFLSPVACPLHVFLLYLDFCFSIVLLSFLDHSCRYSTLDCLSVCLSIVVWLAQASDGNLFSCETPSVPDWDHVHDFSFRWVIEPKSNKIKSLWVFKNCMLTKTLFNYDLVCIMYWLNSWNTLSCYAPHWTHTSSAARSCLCQSSLVKIKCTAYWINE